MKVSNPWVGYLERSYEQIADAIKATISSLVPEITDVGPNNPFMKLILVWAGLMEQLHYYLDTAGREAFLQTCRFFKSAALIAKQYDYRIKGAGAASTDVVFTFASPLSADFTILKGTRLQTGAGMDFYTTQDVTALAAATTATVTAEQALTKTGVALGNSTGAADQQITLADTFVVDGSLAITIQAVQWTAVDTFAFSAPASQHFKCGQDANGDMVVQFGDGVNGAIPTAGQAITASYKTTSGSSGNDVQANSITSIITVLAPPDGVGVTVTNPAKAAGGFDYESLDDLKKRLPLFIRTLERAVTETDYVDVTMLANGVEKAGVLYTCGKYVEMYIAPVGGGQPSAGLLSDTQDFLDTRKMLTTNVTVKGAGVIPMKLEADVRVLDNFTQADVEAELRAAVLDYLSVAQQDIKGSIQLSDLYEIIETTRGVRYSTISKMKLVPYARPLDATTAALTWTPEILDASTGTVKWRIIFTDATHYQLLKETSFIGTYAVGDVVTQAEVEFTVTANGTVGDKYEFYTYKPFGSVELAEPSYIQSSTGDVVLNMTGGI